MTNNVNNASTIAKKSKKSKAVAQSSGQASHIAIPPWAPVSRYQAPRAGIAAGSKGASKTSKKTKLTTGNLVNRRSVPTPFQEWAATLNDPSISYKEKASRWAALSSDERKIYENLSKNKSTDVQKATVFARQLASLITNIDGMSQEDLDKEVKLAYTDAVDPPSLNETKPEKLYANTYCHAHKDDEKQVWSQSSYIAWLQTKSKEYENLPEEEKLKYILQCENEILQYETAHYPYLEAMKTLNLEDKVSESHRDVFRFSQHFKTHWQQKIDTHPELAGDVDAMLLERRNARESILALIKAEKENEKIEADYQKKLKKTPELTKDAHRAMYFETQAKQKKSRAKVDAQPMDVSA